MAQSIQELKKAIDNGTQIQDKLLAAPHNTVKMDKVREIAANIHNSARTARHLYGETRELLDGLYINIQEELMKGKNMDSLQYQSLKKLRTKTTDAKKTLRGYNINKMEELAYKTVEAISKAGAQHYTYRAR
jgi:hypothetical protein